MPTKDKSPEAGHKKSAFEVRLKPGHPTGVYRRAGLQFSASAPTILAPEQMQGAITHDPWLIVTETEIEIERKKAE